jgi:isoquinoline 1-oxidoreductase alpha subunit
MTDLTINGKPVSMDLDPETPILWALRDTLEMTGTKFGCGAAQGGDCQSGQIMSATAVLTSLPKGKKPSGEEIDAAMAGNICRCGTYARIRTAVADAARSLG